MRLIIVAQYPTKLRYQEWWWEEFPKQFLNYFDEVLVLGKFFCFGVFGSKELFAPIKLSIEFEALQIQEFMDLQLREEDVLLLNDLSFPGFFANVLFHKKPSKCFAICHATSLNAYDYFEKVRYSKYPVEKGISKLFDKIIVGSKYHKEKLGWSNINVLPLPDPSVLIPQIPKKRNLLVSVARKVPQKRNIVLEEFIESMFEKITSPNSKTWMEYYTYLSVSKIMLITSKEETFGYQVIDAIMSGCIPIAPNQFSYPELLPREYLYDSVDELVLRINQVVDGSLPEVNKSLVHKESLAFYKNLAFLMS